MEQKFSMSVFNWTDETDNGDIVFKEAFIKDEFGSYHKVTFDTFMTAACTNKYESEVFIVGNIKICGKYFTDKFGKIIR